jgi:hypothetical protein
MLNLPLRRSRLEFCFRLACHLYALFALTLTDLPWPLLTLLGFGIVASLAYLLREYGRGRQGRVHSIVLGREHNQLCFGDRVLDVGPPQASCISEFLIVLNFKQTTGGKRLRGRISVVICPDTLAVAEARRLRRYLRFECP